MERLFASISHALEGAPLLALTACIAWGVLSVLLSPCHLASIPLVVAFVSEQRPGGVRRACWLSSLFALGILLSIAVVGLLTAAAGRLLGQVGPLANYLVAVLFFVVGLHLMGVIDLAWAGAGQLGLRRKGGIAAFILGLVFGVALGPCTFAFMAPVLGIAFKVAASRPAYAVALLLAYGWGHCLVIALAGTFTEAVQKFLNWNEHSQGLPRLKFVCGVLVVLGGLWLIYTASQVSGSR